MTSLSGGNKLLKELKEWETEPEIKPVFLKINVRGGKFKYDGDL